MEDREVHLSDVEALRHNMAWQFLTEGWEEIKNELQATLVSEDFPAAYRTQGRLSVFMLVLEGLDGLEEAIKGIPSGPE